MYYRSHDADLISHRHIADTKQNVRHNTSGIDHTEVICHCHMAPKHM
jgi:hypothetical protein